MRPSRLMLISVLGLSTAAALFLVTSDDITGRVVGAALLFAAVCNALAGWSMRRNERG